MGVTNELSHIAWNHFGPCKVYIKDDDKSTTYGPHLHYLGKCEGVSFQPTFDKVQQRHRIEGQDVMTQERITGASAELSLTLLELLNPEVLQLIYGDKNSSQTIAVADVGYEAIERPIYIYPSTGLGAEQHLRHEGATRLNQFPAPSAFSFASNVNSTVTPGTYYAGVVPIYLAPGGSLPSTTTIDDVGVLDVNHILGTAWDNDAATTGTQMLPFTVAADPNDGGTFTIVDTILDAPLPDGYALYYKTTDAMSTSVCIIVAARDSSGTTTMVFNAAAQAVAGATFSQGTGVVFDYNTGTKDSPSYTTLTQGTAAGNITYDRDRGAFKLVTGGTLKGKGDQVRARYFYVIPPTVSNKVGPTGLSQDRRTLFILSEEQQVEGPAINQPEYIEATIYKANCAGISVAAGFSSDGFYEGTPVTLMCFADASNGNVFGKVEVGSFALKQYAQQAE